MIGQEHYTLWAAETHGTEDEFVHAMLANRVYDFGLRRDIYETSSSWEFGGWYLISWTSQPYLEYAYVGTGGLSPETPTVPMDHLVGVQTISTYDPFLPRGVNERKLWVAFSGIEAALEELVAAPYSPGKLCTGTVEVRGTYFTNEQGVPQPFHGWQKLYVIRRDGIDPPNFMVATGSWPPPLYIETGE